MARARRLHAPGCIVHITARTQGHQPWFIESLRTRIADEIVLASQASGHVVLAYVIMPNHLHLIVRQGSAPLAHLMHRVMHRSAAWLRWTHKLQGHVFEKRYWSDVCLNAAYARAAIVYVHLNPCRAGLCAQPDEYQWSSHKAYSSGADTGDYRLACARAGLQLFANGQNKSVHRGYIGHIRYQLYVDQFLAGRLPSDHIVAIAAKLGDTHWLAEYAAAAQAFGKPEPEPTLYDVAHHLLLRLDPHCPLDLVRSGTRAAKVATIRKQLIAALIAKGFRGVALARFFGVSETVVSRVAVSLRT